MQPLALALLRRLDFFVCFFLAVFFLVAVVSRRAGCTGVALVRPSTADVDGSSATESARLAPAVSSTQPMAKVPARINPFIIVS